MMGSTAYEIGTADLWSWTAWYLLCLLGFYIGFIWPEHPEALCGYCRWRRIQNKEY